MIGKTQELKNLRELVDAREYIFCGFCEVQFCVTIKAK
jgi:hypothetical protein